MPRFICSLMIIFFICYPSIVQPSDSPDPDDETESLSHWESARAAYEALDSFTGLWIGVGSGKWGSSRAEQIFAPVLDGAAICRYGSSTYPVQDLNPKGELHRAVSLIAMTKGGAELELTEYDNEGFIATYSLNLTSSEAHKSWVFNLVHGENLPENFRSRLTFYVPQDNHFTETFELDFGGKGYVKYLTNRLTRNSRLPVPRDCHVE